MTDRGEPSFVGAYLTTWHKNIGFLKDPRFLESYTAGMASGFVSPETHPINLQLQWRTAVACWAAAHAKHLAGDFVECGVNTGSLSLAICRYIDFNASGKQFFLFDTYKGIPLEQMSARDQRKNLQDYNQWYPDCWDRAVQNFSPYPNAKLIRGTVPETLSQASIDRVCYLSLDMNIAYPERAAIEFFWDKLSPGAPVVLDDYAWEDYSEQKAALDDFAHTRGVEILTLPTGQGLLLKP